MSPAGTRRSPAIRRRGSTAAVVEAAVVTALRERRRERLYAAYAEAAQDPAFMADIAATTRACDVTLADGGAREP